MNVINDLDERLLEPDVSIIAAARLPEVEDPSLAMGRGQAVDPFLVSGLGQVGPGAYGPS